MHPQKNDVAVKPRLLKKGDGIVVGEVGPICVAVWRKDSTRTRFVVQRAGLDSVIERSPGGACFFCVVEPTSGPPDEDVRKASSKLFESHGRNLRAIAMVIEGTGFRSALVRSVAAGIVMLMGSRNTPISYFATIEAGAKWMQQFMDVGPIPTFKMNVEQIRTFLDPL
jgi:hypothetical protein